jgi:hypothetical protein
VQKIVDLLSRDHVLKNNLICDIMESEKDGKYSPDLSYLNSKKIRRPPLSSPLLPPTYKKLQF